MYRLLNKKLLLGNVSTRSLSRPTFPKIKYKLPSSNYSTPLYKRYKRNALILAGLIGGYVIYDNKRDIYESGKYCALITERAGVVTLATLRCFYHYKHTLGKKYKDKEIKEIELSRCHKRCALITLHALQSNGGIFIKFGQHIGAMTYLLPREWTETMIPLQDHCPQSTMEDIQVMFKEDLGQNMDELFSEVDPKPIGVASLAQVYVGTLRATDEKVAIKCQHPELKDFIPVDVWLTKTVFKFLDIVFPEYPLTWLGDELQSSIYDELDFCKEAQNAVDTANYFERFKKLTCLRIPKVIKANNRILVMEYIEGKRLDDLNYLDENNISRSEVSSCLAHIFNNMIFTPNVGLHCDPHGGNLAIRATGSNRRHNFEIILFDHGLYRHPATQTRRDYAKFWLALLDHDEEKMKKYAKRFAHITDDQFPLFTAAISGRSIEFALHYDISKRRSNEEIQQMTLGITEGTFLADIMGILSKVPRIVLLILKTNDLTRYLDECLQNPLGPERTFLIMSQYCAKTVFQEEVENLNQHYKAWSIKWCFHYVVLWKNYQKRINQLVFFDCMLWFKRHTSDLFKLLLY